MNKSNFISILLLTLLYFSITNTAFADDPNTGSQNWDCKSHILDSDLAQIQKEVDEANLHITISPNCIGIEENVDRLIAKGLPDKVFILDNKINVCKGYVKTKLFVRFCGASKVNSTCFYNIPDPQYPNTYLIPQITAEPNRYSYGKTLDSFSCEEIKTYNITTREESAKNLDDLKQAMQAYTTKLVSGLKDQIATELKSDTFKSRVVDVINLKNAKAK